MSQENLDYLKRIIAIYYDKYGEMPPLSLIQKKIKSEKNVSVQQFKEYIKELVKADFLIKEGKQYKPNPKKFSVIKKKKGNLLNKIKEQKEEDFYHKIWMKFLRIFLLFIGIGASYMSIYYSYLWLEAFLDSFRAFLLAFIMVGFAVSAFELIIFFWKKKSTGVVWVFSIMWVVVTIFSVISTVAGQYNARMNILTERYEQENLIVENKITKENQKENKENITYQLNLLKEEIKELKKGSWQYRQTKIEIDNKIKKLEEIGNNNTDITKENKRPKDFYLWLSGIIHWRPDSIQFLLSIFPALFIDLIAPFSIAIVVFVKE